jgi:hypothetical protein
MKKRLIQVLRYIKNLFLNILITHLNKHRYSISNHHGKSVEISLLYENISFEYPNKDLFNLISTLYYEYHNFESTYKSPRITSSDPEEFVWDNYMDRKIGEHYVLLPLVASVRKAKNIIEIGTFRGASAKSLILNSDSVIDTFDLLDWRSFPGSYLDDQDFITGRVKQHLADLSDPLIFERYKAHLLNADIIFIDGPKNLSFESNFFNLLFELYRNNPEVQCLLVVDDVKVSTMAKLWNSIIYPKAILDVIGHWSGTGVVLISN